MFNSLMGSILLSSLFIFSSLCATCCQSIDVSVGWRRDHLDWKIDKLKSHYIPAKAKSHLHFKDINSYTVSAKAKWADTAYYVRLAAEYGLTDKGRAHEYFKINSPDLFFPIDVETSNPIKRNSEVYDFNGAVGYPFFFACSRLSIIPLVGFSFHRQHLRVKEKKHFSNSSAYFYGDSSDFFQDHSSSSFFVDSSNPFVFFPSSDPFGSSSDPKIASELGLVNHHRTDTYRFTWYGFYIGADATYALDPRWTLFSEFEYHFYDSCHSKRKSWTGVHFLDSYHKKSRSYGFNSAFGTTFYISNDWFTTVTIDYKWWHAHSKHNELKWQSVGAKIGLDYLY